MAIENPQGGSNKPLKMPGWVIALFAITVFATPFLKMRKSSGPSSNSAAPELHFRDTAGDKLALSNYKGSTVLVNFWASWCMPCMEEMPSLRDLEDRLSTRKFIVLAINVDEDRSILNKLNLSQMPRNLFFDPTDKELEPYEVVSIPVTFIIDPEGIIRETITGPRNWGSDNIVEKIEKYLNP